MKFPIREKELKLKKKIYMI